MARKIIPQSRFGGLAYSEKEGQRSQFLWSKSVDYRSDPTKLRILPSTAKVSGTTVVDLIMDADQYDSTDSYFYGNAGHIYKRTSAEVWTDIHTTSDSTGNGLKYYGEDGFLYYTSDTVIGRYGPMSGTKVFADDFLGAQGGVPTNTASLDLELSSSQYATAADSASLSITGDITLEGAFKMESLPAAAAQMVLMSKWDLNSDERSYKFDLAGISAVFGDGGDGALTISSNTTQAPTDSACTGTAAAYSLTATNASFATDDKILIHQSRGTGAGVWERNEISSYTAGTITLKDALTNSYISGAQVIVLPEYTNVTVDADKTWTAKAWDGTVGGLLTFYANGTVTINGTITADGNDGVDADSTDTSHAGGVGIGFDGGASEGAGVQGASQGEGTAGAGGSVSTSANGNGGGGATESDPLGVGGGGGGNGTAGTIGVDGGGGTPGDGGATAGTTDLTTMVFGGGGGGGAENTGYHGGGGGGGAGIVFFYGVTVTMGAAGSITTDGGDGGNGDAPDNDGGGGGGAGGSVLVKAQTATLGTTLITAAAGAAGTGGGAGGVGRIHLDYYTSYTGTTTPTLDVSQDDSLVTTTTYQLRFSVSTDGTSANSEILSKTITDPQTGQWYRYAVKWDASAKQANFFIDGVDQGQSTGAKTSIYDSTALFGIGASLDASSNDENHFDGKFDDGRVFNDLRTDAELDNYKEVELSGGEAGLVAYYKVNSSTADSSANSNTLTLVNAPSYDTDDVAFSGATTRLDLDQSLDTSGQVYTLAVAIDEGITHRQTFVPVKEPLKSIEVLLLAAGTGDWTLTVHDAQNRSIGTKTIVNGDLNAAAGDQEFIFATPLRVILGASYHFHVTSTVADGTVTTTTTVDLETVDYHSYFSFLVDDPFHPVEQITNKLAIGNERYVATWDAITYTPHAITLPSGYRVRCLGHWREYLAIGTTRGTNIEDYDQGRIFFWDGISTTYNFFIDVFEGGINAILGGDPMYFMAGYSGDFMRYDGGLPKKILRMPKVETTDTLEINRKALSMYRALVHIGMAEDSASTTIERGVFSFGTLDRELPESLSFDYPLSIGVTTGATLEIGCLFPIGKSLFISWRNASSYGVDSVSPSNNPYSTATVEFLISDASKIWAEKQAQVIRTYFKKLVSGDSVTLKYKIDRASAWTSGTAVTTANKKEARLSLPTKANRFNEVQVAIDLATTSSTTPEIYGWALDIEDAQRERRT